jgi:hypothetical protein
METVRHSVFLLAAQIIVAAALSGSYAQSWVRRHGTRAQRATWFRAARAMLRLTPLAVFLFLGGAGWVLWKDLSLPKLGLAWWVGATLPVTLGMRWMLRAGSLQSNARLLTCRRLARLGGWYSAGGALLGVAALFAVPVNEPSFWFRPVVATTLVLVGVCGLLGGLSGKPRPVGAIGTILWLAGWVVVVHESLP